ncbi:cytochrome P450 [Haloarculaceae archaeon H-GB11]|nr:cytochrome P450 [Haloarculaceae archaeon H-GB11]
MASYEISGTRVYQLNDPDLIEHVLVHHNENYVKGEVFQNVLQPSLGNGLITSEGDLWREQRQLLQQAFSPELIAGYADVMVDATERLLADWESGTVRDVHADMMHLTVEIAAKALFDVDVREMEADISDALETLMDHTTMNLQRPVKVPLWVPTPANRRYQRALDALDDIAERVVAQHDRDGEGTDVVSLLLADRDPDDPLVRDQIVTFLLAGHETTALALTYTLHALGRTSDAERTLHEELDAVLGDGLSLAEDLPSLPVLDRTVTEGLRLYPPAWELIREADEDDQIGSYHVPAGTTIMMHPWVLQRDPRYYDDPDAFRPERWAGEESDRPTFAYFPFGGGPRRCIGDRFARLEAELVLATICRDWRLDPLDDLSFSPSITLRPDGPVRMRVERR